MVKSYLRYSLAATHGIVTSPTCNVAIDAAGGALFTGQLERIGVWSVKRGTEVRTLVAPGSDASALAEVTCLVAAPKGTLVAAGYADGIIRVFDFTTGALVVVLSGHKKAVSALAYSADGTRLVSGARDTDVILWDVVAESGLCRFKGHRDEVTAVAFVSHQGRELLVSSSKDTLIKVWDPSAHVCVQTVIGTRSEVWSFAVVPAGDRLLVGAGDNQLRVFAIDGAGGAAPSSSSSSSSAGSSVPPAPSAADSPPLRLLGTLTRQSTDRVAHVGCAPDGMHVGLQSAGKIIEVYRRRSVGETRRRVQRRLKRHREKLGKRARPAGGAAADADAPDEDGGVESLQLAGTTLADIDALLAQLEEAAELERAALAGGSSSTLSVDASRAAAVGRAAHSPYVIASDEWELVGLVSVGHKLTSFLFQPSAAAAGAGARGSIEAAAAAPLQLLASTHDNRVEFYTLQRDAAHATAAGDASVKLPSGALVPQAALSRSFLQSGHRSDVRSVAVSADGAMLLTTSTGQAKVWNAKTGTCVRTLDFGSTPLASIGGDEDDDEEAQASSSRSAAAGSSSSSSSAVGLCAAFGPGGKHALVGLKDGRLLLFDLGSGDLLESHKAHASALWSLTVRPDETGCATGGADKEVKFWDFDVVAPPAAAAAAQGGKPAAGATLAKQLSLVHSRSLKLNDEVLCVKYSRSKDPSKLLIAVALLDATVKVFFDDTLKFFLSLYGHKLPVMAMDISADSTLLVTASADKNVKLWGLDFGDLHRSFLAHGDSVMAVAFVANTHYFFTGGKDRLIKYYDGDRFEHIFTLVGHKGEVWGLAVAPDGTFFASVGHDRSIRVWRRTDEQVFLEEEREKEFDTMLEGTMRDPDGEALLSGEDAVGPLGADGTALLEDGGAPSTVTLGDHAGSAAAAGSAMGSGAEGVSTVVAHATRDTVKGGERLTEALALAAEETDKWREYAQDCAAAEAAGDGAEAVDAPARNLLLLGLTPADYILREMRAIRPSEMDQVLLVLPFADALQLLRYLHHLLSGGRAVELCCRAALLLLRVHSSQIAASAALAPLIVALQAAMHSAVQAQKRRIGVNIAALRFLDRALEAEAASSTFGPAPPPPAPAAGGKGVSIGKRRNVHLL